MWPNLPETTDLVSFTEKILNGNFFFSLLIGKTLWNYFSFINFALTLKVHVCLLLSTPNACKPRYEVPFLEMTKSKQISYLENVISLLFTFLNAIRMYWDTLHDFVPFAQFRKCENTHGGVLLCVKLQPVACTNSTK